MPTDPLVFRLHPGGNDNRTAPLDVQLHLVDDDNAESSHHHDTGFVAWPAAVVLARWLGLHPTLLLRSAAVGNVLELGAGVGLVGLAAALLMQEDASRKTVDNSDDDDDGSGNLIFSDYNPAVLQNLQRNICLNHLEDCTRVVGLDFFDQQDSAANCWTDMEGMPQPQVPLVLAADVLAYSNDADNVAHTLMAALQTGGTALVVSPESRFGVRGFPEACRNLGLTVQVKENLLEIVSFDGPTGEPVTARDNQARLMQDLEKTISQHHEQGYEYSTLQMFIIEKPLEP